MYQIYLVTKVNLLTNLPVPPHFLRIAFHVCKVWNKYLQYMMRYYHKIYARIPCLSFDLGLH